MKRNFYLQHPIMAMNDPRMKNSIDKERLKAPEPIGSSSKNWRCCRTARATGISATVLRRPENPLSYLQKIIREYDLFIFDDRTTISRPPN